MLRWRVLCRRQWRRAQTSLRAVTTPDHLLKASDYACTGGFALSGSVAAATCGLDLFGATTIGAVTALGGGTIRDTVILHRPPFWTREPEYMWIACASAAAAFCGWPWIPADAADSFGLKNGEGNEGPLLWWADAIGAGTFAVMGAQKAIALRRSSAIAVLAGMSTATGGGLIRDVICRTNQTTRGAGGRILHSEKKDLYATAAAVGAIVFVAGQSAPKQLPLRIGASVGSVVVVRCLAQKYRLGLPTWTGPS